MAIKAKWCGVRTANTIVLTEKLVILAAIWESGYTNYMTTAQEVKEKKMNESKYSVTIDGTMVAQRMNLETALILVKGLFKTYYAEPKISICIEVEDEPMKHGHWEIDMHGNWACSLCGNDPYHDNMKNMNYCPKCGAKMDEVKNNAK